MMKALQKSICGKTIAIVVIGFTLVATVLVGTSYAAMKYGTLHRTGYQNGSDVIEYAYRNGYDGYSYGDYYNVCDSWMWVKNTNRDVKAGAIYSQAGYTVYEIGEPAFVEFGPMATNFYTNPAGEAVESYFNDVVPKGDLFAWGYGKVRDPLGNMHEIGTEENWIEIVW